MAPVPKYPALSSYDEALLHQQVARIERAAMEGCNKVKREAQILRIETRMQMARLKRQVEEELAPRQQAYINAVFDAFQQELHEHFKALRRQLGIPEPEATAAALPPVEIDLPNGKGPFQTRELLQNITAAVTANDNVRSR